VLVSWRGIARIAPLVCALIVAPASVGPAWGQPTDDEKAAALQAWDDGLDLEKKADYAAALEKFQKVGKFKMTPHVRFHIALCEEKLGQLVAALRGFELAQAEALKMGKDAQVVADKAPARVEALRKRVAAVRVEVKGTVLYSRVLIDGQPLIAKDFGTLVSVDPGVHTIAVETDGAITQKKEVTLAEKGYETITLQIDDPEKPVPTATVTASASDSVAPPPPPPPSRLPAFVLGGVGVASFIGAGVFYGMRVGALGDFEAQCPSTGDVRSCPKAAQAPYNDAQTFTLAAGVMTGVGVAALAGAGVYWLVTQRQGAKPQAKPAIGVSVSPGGIRVSGSF